MHLFHIRVAQTAFQPFHNVSAELQIERQIRILIGLVDFGAHDDFNHIKSTLSGSMQALVGSGQLTANELQAAATLGAMLPQLNTEGTDRFHRTNDVFGVNLNFDF